MKAEVRQQEELDKVWKVKLNPNAEDFRSELLEKYTIKILFV